MNPGTLGYILVIEVLKTKDLDGPRIPVSNKMSLEIGVKTQ